jgi:hypothetical protein
MPERIIDCNARHVPEFVAPNHHVELRVRNVVAARRLFRFDLAKLESLRNSITTRDGKVEVAWTQLLESIESLSGDMLQRVVPAATDRFDHHKVMRLFELAVFGRVLVVVGTNKTPARLETYRNISDVSGRDPRVKYALLFAALAFNYLDLDAPEDEPEDDGGEAPTE